MEIIFNKFSLLDFKTLWKYLDCTSRKQSYAAMTGI